MAKLTSAEYNVLLAADAASNAYIMGTGSLYQPQEGAASDAATRLLGRGMLRKMDDWPDCLEVTEAGLEALDEESERRDYDASDPASPQNTAEDARDSALPPPWWEER